MHPGGRDRIEEVRGYFAIGGWTTAIAAWRVTEFVRTIHAPAERMVDDAE
jgi:hypothetical protein